MRPRWPIRTLTLNFDLNSKDSKLLDKVIWMITLRLLSIGILQYFIIFIMQECVQNLKRYNTLGIFSLQHVVHSLVYFVGNVKFIKSTAPLSMTNSIQIYLYSSWNPNHEPYPWSTYFPKVVCKMVVLCYSPSLLIWVARSWSTFCKGGGV